MGTALPCLVSFFLLLLLLSRGIHILRGMYMRVWVDDINRSKVLQRKEEEEEANVELKDRGLWDPCHYTCSMLEREMMLSKGNCIGVYSFQRRQP